MTRTPPSTSGSTELAHEIEVREARADEWAAAGAVTAAAYREFFVDGSPPHRSEYLSRIADVARRAHHTLVLVALLDGEIVGSATLELDGRVEPGTPPPSHGTAHLRMVGVTPAARRRGVARALLVASAGAARAAGRHMLTLNTTAYMTNARSLYESLGFARGPDVQLDGGTTLFSYSLRIAGPTEDAAE